MYNETISIEDYSLVTSPKTNSVYFTNELRELIKTLPPKQQAYAVIIGMVGVIGLSAYAIHQGGTISKNKDSWSISINSSAI